MDDLLLAIPNVSEGADRATIDAIAAAFTQTGGATLLDVHADADHGRTVFTLAGRPGALAPALRDGAREVLARIDLRHHSGLHPHVGALDVAPFVHLDDARRGAACAEALHAGALLGDLGLPVVLYGALGGGRTRADLRRGGPARLDERVRAGEIVPDFGAGGTPSLHASAGAVLLAARPPLIAFNVELAPPATLEDAQAIARRIREGGEDGLPGLKAIGLTLAHRGGVAQISMNVEDHRALPLCDVVAAIARHAPVAEAELVGLAPRAAFAGFPAEVTVRNRRTVEDALARVS